MRLYGRTACSSLAISRSERPCMQSASAIPASTSSVSHTIAAIECVCPFTFWHSPLHHFILQGGTGRRRPLRFEGTSGCLSSLTVVHAPRRQRCSRAPPTHARDTLAAPCECSFAQTLHRQRGTRPAPLARARARGAAQYCFPGFPSAFPHPGLVGSCFLHSSHPMDSFWRFIGSWFWEDEKARTLFG